MYIQVDFDVLITAHRGFQFTHLPQSKKVKASKRMGNIGYNL